MTAEDLQELFDRQTLLRRFGSKRQNKLAEQVLAMLSPTDASSLAEIMETDVHEQKDTNVHKEDREGEGDSTRYARSVPIPVRKVQFAVSSAGMRRSHPPRTESTVRDAASSPVIRFHESHIRVPQRAGIDIIACNPRDENSAHTRNTAILRTCPRQVQPSLPLEECFSGTPFQTQDDDSSSLAKARAAARRARNLAAALDGRPPPFPDEDLSSEHVSLRKKPGCIRAARAGIPQRLARESKLVLREQTPTIGIPPPAIAVEGPRVGVPTAVWPFESGIRLPRAVARSVQGEAVHTGIGSSPRQTRVHFVEEIRRPNDGYCTSSGLVRWLSRGSSGKRNGGDAVRGRTKGLNQSMRGRRDLSREREIMGGWG